MEKIIYNMDINEAMQIKERAKLEKKQRDENGEPTTDDYKKGEQIYTKEKLESIRKYKYLLLPSGCNLSNASPDDNIELINQINKYNTLLRRDEVFAAAQVIINSYENNLLTSRTYDNRQELLGEGMLAGFLSHGAKYALDGLETEGDIFEVRNILKKLINGYSHKMSAEELYDLCKSSIDKLSKFCTQDSGEDIGFEIREKVGVSHEKYMRSIITDALNAKTRPCFKCLLDYMKEEELLDEKKKSLYNAYKEWESNINSTFQLFIDSSVKFDEIVNKFKADTDGVNLESDYILKKTLYKDNVVQLCEQKDNAQTLKNQ